MTILFDTNVLIAAFISHGFCQELLERCLIEHDLITSEFILSELKEKLTGKFGFSHKTADEAVELLRSRMKIVRPANINVQVCRDPDDDNVLAAAAAGLCDFIVTGDKDLLDIGTYKGVQIVTPRAFGDSEFPK